MRCFRSCNSAISIHVHISHTASLDLDERPRTTCTAAIAGRSLCPVGAYPICSCAASGSWRMLSSGWAWCCAGVLLKQNTPDNALPHQNFLIFGSWQGPAIQKLLEERSRVENNKRKQTQFTSRATLENSARESEGEGGGPKSGSDSHAQERNPPVAPVGAHQPGMGTPKKSCVSSSALFTLEYESVPGPGPPGPWCGTPSHWKTF